VIRVPAALAAGLNQKSAALAALLAAKRAFITPPKETSDGLARYDPRFLVFEFTWNLLLRARQVELVREFAAAVKQPPSTRQGSGIVRQMIMGAYVCNLFFIVVVVANVYYI
jgi:hypothetical protein